LHSLTQEAAEREKCGKHDFVVHPPVLKYRRPAVRPSPKTSALLDPARSLCTVCREHTTIAEKKQASSNFDSAASVDNDHAPAPRFLTVDGQVPAAIRQLLDEADGCLNMGFANGGTACARRAIQTIMTTEGVSGDDYPGRLISLSTKHPAIPPALFHVLELLGQGDEPLRTDALKALIATAKAVVYELYVLRAERIERLTYVTELVESLKRSK
jgi:hypothetical protein